MDLTEVSLSAALPFGPNGAPTPQRMCLRDGRRLGFAEYGPAGGRPVILLHGLFGSRLQRHPDESLLTAFNLRLIVPERPGYGLSDPQPGRSVTAFADDLAALSDYLGCQRFALIGVSCGAPYALATAVRLPARVTEVAIVSGLGEIRSFADGEGVAWPHRLIFSAAKHSRYLLAPLLSLMHLGLRRRPAQLWERLVRSLPPPDRNTVARREIRELLQADLHEAFRQGALGAMHEIAALVRPWDFNPADIRAPLTIWHGDADTTVPIRMAQRLQAQLPSAVFHRVAGAGHFLIVDRWRDILSRLTTPAAGAR